MESVPAQKVTMLTTPHLQLHLSVVAVLPTAADVKVTSASPVTRVLL